MRKKPMSIVSRFHLSNFAFYLLKWSKSSGCQNVGIRFFLLVELGKRGLQEPLYSIRRKKKNLPAFLE